MRLRRAEARLECHFCASISGRHVVMSNNPSNLLILCGFGHSPARRIGFARCNVQ